jgi:general secretion pathway protein D
VLRDYTENVKRMLELIKEIDVAVPSEFESAVIPIKYAKATEIASALNSLSSGGGGTTVGASSGGGGRTQSGSRSTGSSFNRTGTSGGGYQGGQNPSSPFGQQGTTAPAQTPASSSFSERLSNLVRKAGQTGDINILGQTKMIADERSNSLLIYASHEDMKTIKDIISKLDVVLAQVLIEAVIIEVTLNDNRSLGLNYAQQTPRGIGSFTGIGAINNGTPLNASSFANAVGGSGTNGTASALPGGLSFLGTFGQDLDVTLTAVASDSHAKILQRPRIQTSHNEPASLFVGESRPYPSGSFYGGGSFGGYSSIQAVNIGVTLEVTPLINPDGLVVMDIHQTIESANGTVVIANVGEVPVTSRKEAVAKVSVRDHDTIMLGGLIETSKSKSVSGVPFLKDIPLLGNLFRSSSDKEVRNELIVLIRPTVLPTPEVAAMTARAEKDRMPGVRRAEAEILQEDARRLRNANKDLDGGDKKARKSPPPEYTPEPVVIPAPASSLNKSDDGKFSELP